MNTIVTINLLFSTALIVAGLRFETTEGQNATISFDIDEVEKADQVRIAFKQDDKENAVVVAQQPWTYEETPPAGVSLRVEKGRVNVTIQHVNISRHSGLYTARAFFGKKPYKENAVLVINKLQSSSSPAPPHTSTPKPPSSSELQWLYVVIPVVVVVIIISIVILCVCFWKRRRECEPAADVEGARGALCLQMCSQKRELENCCNACVSVPMNGCEEKTEPLLQVS